MISKHEKIKEIAKSHIHWNGGRLDILDYVDKQVELEKANSWSSLKLKTLLINMNA